MQRDAQKRENPLLLDFLMTSFLPSQENLKSYAFTKERVSAVAKFLRSRFPELRLQDVGRLHGEALKDFGSDASPRTIQANLQKLKQAMNYAVDLGLLDADPLRRCKAPQYDNRRMRTCSIEDVHTMLTAFPATSDLRHIVRLLALTGLRPSNVLRLRADEVVGDTVRIPPEKMKNNRWGIVPISGFVQEALNALPASPYYFPSRLCSQRPRRSIYDGWRVAVFRTEIEWLRPYDLRHFFASQLAKQGATEQQVGRLLCHVSTSVTSRYIHQDIEDLRGFVEELSQRFVRRNR
jgi:integrase